MARGDRLLEHVLRRLAFGASTAELVRYSGLSPAAVIELLLNYEQAPNNVDDNIGKPEYVAVTTRGQFSPNTVINDARQRELFRMVHSQRPLQEKMALFWHNHFATAFSKINGTFGSVHATKMMAARPDQVAGAQRGQYQLFRDMATATSASCSSRWRAIRRCWCGSTAATTRRRGRRRTSAARSWSSSRWASATTSKPTSMPRRASSPAGVSGWRAIARRRRRRTTSSSTTPGQHDANAKTFTFAIYPDGRKTIPARAAAQGMQDGLDLISALARQPATAFRLARKLYAFFISEVSAPDERVVSELANTYMQNDGNIKAVLRRLFSTEAFLGSEFAHYSWPRRVRRAVDQGDRLERAVGRRGDDAARQHGPAAVRAARRQRLGARARVVLDRLDAVAHELRGDADGQPEVQSRPRAARRTGRRRSAWSTTC